MMQVLISFLLCLSVLLSGCASIQRSPALYRSSPNEGYRYESLKGAGNSESLFLILTFSGGGTRAMAMAYGVLEELRATPVQWEGVGKSLLDEVDVISAVSGGSFTAACYGLYRDKLFDDFPDKVLYRNIGLALKKQIFTPSGLYRMIATLSRTDIANRYYDRHIFNGATYADFPKTRPFILINATDMMKGARFEFSQNQMDLLGVDLSKLHISTAVTASSSFPFIFKPLRIENHSGAYHFTPPDWVAESIEGKDMGPGRLSRIKTLRSYMEPKERPIIALVDGGLSDTFGLRGPYEALSSTDISWSLHDKMEKGEIRTVAVIVVDATTDKLAPDSSLGDLARLGLFETLNTATTALLNNYAYLTLEQTYELFQGWNSTALRYEAVCRHCREHQADAVDDCIKDIYPLGPPPGLDLHIIHLRFDDLPDKEERDYLNSVQTSLHLPAKTVDRIRAAARSLLRQSSPYNALLESLQEHESSMAAP